MWNKITSEPSGVEDKTAPALILPLNSCVMGLFPYLAWLESKRELCTRSTALRKRSNPLSHARHSRLNRDYILPIAAGKLGRDFHRFQPFSHRFFFLVAQDTLKLPSYLCFKAAVPSARVAYHKHDCALTPCAPCCPDFSVGGGGGGGDEGGWASGCVGRV